MMTDELAESFVSPGLMDGGTTEDEEEDEQLEAISEEEQRIQREKINMDIKRLENYLENFDFFSGKSHLDRHKLRFHADYLKAHAIYYDNIMVFPDVKSQGNTH